MAPDPDETKRRSRGPWPLRTQETTTPAGTHDHGLPGWLKPALIGCGVAILALAVAVTFLMIYIIGRGQVRDQQNRDTREQVREQLCDVLDGLPQGGVLDLTREKLGCGPGMSIDSYPPAVRDQLRGTASATTAPRTPPPAPERAGAAPEPVAPYVPPTFSTDGASPPTPTASSQPSAPADPIEPNPLLDTVCDLTSVCLEIP